jgi:hypothetical protein
MAGRAANRQRLKINREGATGHDKTAKAKTAKEETRSAAVRGASRFAQDE